MTNKPVLYFGDTSLATAAGYLAGLLSLYDLGFDYVPSDQNLNGQTLAGRNLFIVSDYPAARMAERKQLEIVRQVEAGAGLLMVGGWESFSGQDGKWAGTPLGSILPVHIAKHDDRINCDQPALVRCVSNHAICAGLPWDSRPPAIGGFNRISAKDDATVVLEVQRFTACQQNNGFVFEPLDQHPLLVVGSHGKGRTAALATDLAPHWVGGLVDWGIDKRVVASAPESWSIEVGEHYAQFVHNLVSWVGNFQRVNARAGNTAASAR
ncbi:MAG TPA: glutamine amidotransferase [Tepidisphaeraceae bacterium]|jgi:uncharacterized membrane protein